MAKKQTGCACCSEILCKVYGFFAGAKTQYQERDYCGGTGATCIVTDKHGNDKYHYFGNDFKSFPRFIKVTTKALYNRIF